MDLSGNQATLSFLMSVAFRELFPGRKLIIEHSFGNGYFCHDHQWDPFTEKELTDLQNKMKEFIENEIAIVFEEIPRDWVIQHFYKLNSISKSGNLQLWNDDPIPMIWFDIHCDYRIESMTKEKSNLGPFEILKYNDGFLLRFPNLLNPFKLAPFHNQPKLFSIMEEHEQWGDILGIRTIDEVNKAISSGEIRELTWVAEGLHEKKISYIADHLVKDFPHKRVITIAGPSSSGKTTFAKRLAIQLRVNGFRTRQISMDDYFFDRDKVPVDQNGLQDFESIHALDTTLLSERLDKLLNGKAIPVRHFDFESGQGMDTAETMELGEWDFVILEGIHGLNPKLSELLGRERLQCIYISAITQLNIDSIHRVSTSDNRLLRRMARDYKFRNYLAEDTLRRWPSVRLGEEKNIFPFQEEADLMFNSALLYELPVLAGECLPLLEKLNDHPEFGKTVFRLKILLTFFMPLDKEMVPGVSILREFIGQSEFSY